MFSLPFSFILYNLYSCRGIYIDFALTHAILIFGRFSIQNHICATVLPDDIIIKRWVIFLCPFWFILKAQGYRPNQTLTQTLKKWIFLNSKMLKIPGFKLNIWYISTKIVQFSANVRFRLEICHFKLLTYLNYWHSYKSVTFPSL